MIEFGEFLLPPIFCIIYTIIRKQFTGEPVNINIQSFINIIQEKSWVITTKKGKGKLPIICGNGERLIPIYGKEPMVLYLQSVSECAG